MPTLSINLRQLRDTRRLKKWLKAGKTVELRERNRVLGRIVPERPSQSKWNGLTLKRRRKRFWAAGVFPAPIC